MSKLIYPELSFRVVGVCMDVHRQLGPSLLEKYYQRAVEQELNSQKIEFQREVCVQMLYKEKSIGRYFVDFVIENKLILELKAQPNLLMIHRKQVLSYLKQLDLGLGILVNFRNISLKQYRVINSEWSGKD